MNVSIEDLRALRSRFSADFLWFRRNGEEYVISDPTVIDEAERCFDTLRTLRPQQEALSERDRALDREEEALDREHDAWSDAADDVDKREARHDERRRDVETRLRTIREQQRDLEKEERILDEREEALEKVAEARLDRLIDDALRRDLARPLMGR
jgi:predicted RNase H-like nuclease (RuvC/YqgF family)